jgi:FkbM family methyltransferase
MKIFYGITNKLKDITNICLKKLTKKNIITIPSGDCNRSNYFKDHLIGIKKKIYILNNNILSEYDEYNEININITDNTISTIYHDTLENIHSKLQIKYGSFNEEMPEQKMAFKYLTGNESVLEIGGNIGRNSLIIAYILRNNNNFVTLETDVNIANQLIENRDLNNFNFHIENSALSNRKLIQKDWETIPSETLIEGYFWVNTITLYDLNIKYNIKFDTLVLDCEGAFYYILIDMPEILEGIKLIIMENDYYDISKKQFVDKVLVDNNFYVDYVERGGWGPCYNNFFEVWKKN